MLQPSRRHGILIAALTLAATGCQNYNFNPVGHCLIQPGSERVKLSDISTADVLFVVDDSGSMGGEQQKIAENFQSFIQNLDQTNLDRKANAVPTIDFHVAVTSTSVFYSAPTTAFCRTDCPGVTAGTPVCCNTSGTSAIAPLKQVKACASASDACNPTRPGDTCKTTCNGFTGSLVCCDSSNNPARTEPVLCEASAATAGAACGDLQTRFRFDSTCSPGNATNGGAYPGGAFIGQGDNPRVLHFDKEIYADTRPSGLPACSSGTSCNRQGYTSAQLQGWFAQQVGGTWQGNVIAGTCGSGEEQGLQAGKLALQKALSAEGQQDTRNEAGEVTTAKALWPHAADKAKLVLVFVGDEDDCSSPADAVNGVILSGPPGSDTCVADAGLPDGQRKQYAVSDMVSYFTGLGRPLGAAFITSTQGVCEDASCTPGICCDYACTGSTSTCTSATCGGQAPGSRLLQAAAQFRSKGADVVVGSICDPDFDVILDRIADIVKPPTGLTLPTQPASSDITLLRIADTKGTTRKTCHGPAPVNLTADEAVAAGWDWWFTASAEQVTADQKRPTAASRYVFINHATHACEAGAGETYSADYIGQLPAGGCQSKAQCASVLGGRSDDWSCFAGVLPSGEFVVPSPTSVGTCLCSTGDANNPGPGGPY
ncbi:MAG: hypothetical protein QM767_20020 [Anaeromyxobacter sp.]